MKSEVFDHLNNHIFNIVSSIDATMCKYIDVILN